MAVRILMLTLPPQVLGGVAAKAEMLARSLRDCGHQVTVATYATLTHNPDLCVTELELGPQTRDGVCFGGFPAIVIGCKTPEFEYNYTAGSSLWRNLIKSHDRHVAVGGSVLIANPLAEAGVPHLVWCASDLEDDRRPRHDDMNPLRRVFDSIFIEPGLRAQERCVLGGAGRIYTVSRHSAERLNRLSPNREHPVEVMSIPTDVEFFTPADEPPGFGRIGFAGRLADPRKNPLLLFAALAEVRKRRGDVMLAVTGEASPALHRMAVEAGVGDAVAFVGVLDRLELRRFYQGLDVLVIPSLREGFGIVGAEAMACGVPVVSTRCGGPLDYLDHRVNGLLCGFEPGDVADAILEIIGDRALRDSMSEAARRRIVRDFGIANFRRSVAEAWHAVWGEDVGLR